MKKRGFTLIELMAVVMIIALIALLTFPNIINQIKKSKESKNDMVNNIVIAQAKKYVSENKNKFDIDYCLNISELINNNYIKEDIVKDMNNKVVMITYDDKIKYEVVDKDVCNNNVANVYEDNNGQKYIEVEYIESTGMQYIDTKYVFKNKPKVIGEIMITSNIDLDIMGMPQAKTGCFIVDFLKNTLYYRYSSSSYTTINTNIQTNNWYSFEFSDKVIVDGIEKGSIASYDFSSNTQSFLIGKGRTWGSARFKEIKMIDGDNLVRDLIPVYRKSDKTVGMFDTKEKKFYYSETGNNFYKPCHDNNLPNKDTELSYIESLGSQYIDTNYVFKTKPKVIGEIMITSNNDADIMGTSIATQGCFIIDFVQGKYTDYRYSTTLHTSIGTGTQVNRWYNFEFSDKVIVDGVEKGSVSSYDFSSNTQNFLIGKGRSFGSARFKEIKMYDGDELVRDLVPYYKKDINKVGMLDKVNNVFYQNQGTGEFLWGQKV